MGVLAVGVLALASGCATEELLSERRNEGIEEAALVSLRTDFEPVHVGEAEFRLAMATLLLDRPMRVASVETEKAGGGWAPGTGGSGAAAWQAELARDYAGYCELRGQPGDCLTLLDGPHGLQAKARLKVALAFAVEPALEGVRAEVRATLNPSQVLTTVTLGIMGYMALWLVPDPVFTKGLALASTVLMWGYLGSELFELVRAYMRLAEETEQATTFAELREAGERFGRVLGPNSVRVLILLATAAVGQTAELISSRAPSLPGFKQAASLAGRRGLRLMNVATGAERLIVSSAVGSVRAVLPVTAVAMVAAGGGNGDKGGGSTPREGNMLPNGHRAFKSFRDFKAAMGPAGDGKQWHHIVEQRDLNLNRFGPEALHNTENVVPLEKPLHEAINSFYSSKNLNITGSYDLTIRQWIGAQSYEAQRQFGMTAIRNIRTGVWPGMK